MEVRLAESPDDFLFVAHVSRWRHYLRNPVPYIARPVAYILEHNKIPLGIFVFSIPQATDCRHWWGKKAKITKWQVQDLSRVWVSPLIQSGGYWAKPEIVPGRWVNGRYEPTILTWALSRAFKMIQKDYLRLWPPVEPEKPYHIRLIISYHDPKYHDGYIYRAMSALPMYTYKTGKPRMSSSKLFGWCWPIKQPFWNISRLNIIRQRQMRLPLCNLQKPKTKKRKRKARI